METAGGRTCPVTLLPGTRREVARLAGSRSGQQWDICRVSAPSGSDV